MGVNPLINTGSYRQRPGQQKAPDRPDRVTPVPEHYEGVSFPYRGTQNHGVAPSKTDDPEQYYDAQAFDDETDKVVFLPAEVEVEPVPVRIVNETSRERNDWRAGRFLVTEIPQEILGRNDKRKSVRIKVHAFKSDGTTANTDPIFIGNDAGLRPYTGFQISAGEELYPFKSTENVFAITLPGVFVEISMISEFSVEL